MSPAAVAAAPRHWPAELTLRYWRDGDATRAHDRHHGPLRVLQALYPEGPGICHHVVVHPPGGIVGGDTLQTTVSLEPGSHALITTPGAARFYRSGGDPACQRAVLRVEPGSRLEWLPLETIAYPGCDGRNEVLLQPQGDGEILGWDLLALGLPQSGQAFAEAPRRDAPAREPAAGADAPALATAAARPRPGRFSQCLTLPGVWREQGRIQADDQRLLRSPLGLAGKTVLLTLWWASGQALQPARREALLAAARAVAPPAGWPCGVTSPHPQVVVARGLADAVQPAFAWAQAVRAAWRQAGWGLPAAPPRVWKL